MTIRIRGRLKRTNDYRPKNVFLPEKMVNELKKKFDADSDQSLYLALALYALGDVDLKKMKEVNLEDYIEKYLSK